MITRPGRRRLAALMGLPAVWLLLLCGPALAHARLLEAEPEDGATLTQAPDQVRLRFDEPIEAEFDPLKVYDQQGNRVDEHDARVDPDNARILVATLKKLPASSYMVEWRITSLDGHPVGGEYVFEVAGGSADEPEDAAQANAEDARESEERASDRAESESAQDAGGISAHIVHIVGWGFGALVVLVLALLRKN